MSPRQLDKMLEARSTKFFPSKPENNVTAGGDVAEAMQSFVNAKSSVEGVEAVDRRSVPVRGRPASARHSEMSVEDETEEEVKLDVGGILQSMHELLSKCCRNIVGRAADGPKGCELEIHQKAFGLKMSTVQASIIKKCVTAKT